MSQDVLSWRFAAFRLVSTPFLLLFANEGKMEFDGDECTAYNGFTIEKLVRWQRTNYTNLHFNAKVQYVRTSVLLVCIIFFYKHCEYFVIIS